MGLSSKADRVVGLLFVDPDPAARRRLPLAAPGTRPTVAEPGARRRFAQRLRAAVVVTADATQWVS